jgi:hypothetical protein
MPRSTASISAGRNREAEMSMLTEPTRNARSTLCTSSNPDATHPASPSRKVPHLGSDT